MMRLLKKNLLMCDNAIGCLLIVMSLLLMSFEQNNHYLLTTLLASMVRAQTRFLMSQQCTQATKETEDMANKR